MKKILIIGAIALVIVGCVLAAGCTSNTITTDDFAVGTWTTDDGKTNVVLTNDFHGVYVDGDYLTDIVWKKTADGKYILMRGDEIQENVTIDGNTGILTNETGTVLTKVLIGTGASNTEEMNEKLFQLLDKLDEIEGKLEDKKDELIGILADKENELESLKEDINFQQEILQKAEEDVQKLKQQAAEKTR